MTAPGRSHHAAHARDAGLYPQLYTRARLRPWIAFMHAASSARGARMRDPRVSDFRHPAPKKGDPPDTPRAAPAPPETIASGGSP
jgi:hypothetical protein